MKIKLDTNAIGVALVDALHAMGEDWEQEAKDLAPVRKARTSVHRGFDSQGKAIVKPVNVGERQEGHAVRLFPVTKKSTLTEVQRRFRREIFTRTPKERAEYLAQMSDISYDKRREQAQVFRYAEGPLKGKTPELVVARGNKIVGVSAPGVQGGTLRDSIHALPVEVEDNRYTIRLRADAPYAESIEKGFRHKGGRKHKGASTTIEGRWFMRNSRTVVVERLKSGDYFRKG